MIQINLLPEELRRLEKTPLGRFIVILTGAALVTAALFIFLVLQFRTLPEALRQKNETIGEKRQKEALPQQRSFQAIFDASLQTPLLDS